MATAPDGSPLVTALNGSSVSLESCTLSTCPLAYAQVQYQPSFVANVAYLIIFSIIVLAQFTLGLVYRTWGFMIGMCCGLALEVIGYAGRLGLHNNPFDFTSFIIYLVCLTIAPAFLTASIYLCLSRLIVIHGQHLARFAPKVYTITFISCDVVSLLLQAAGGGLAASADTNQSQENLGVNIMIAGLAFQVASLLVFMGLSLDFILRVRRGYSSKESPEYMTLTKRGLFKLFPFALALATLTIFVRCVYRVAELEGGFAAKLANNQTLFMILEGPMIIAATIALTVCHPGLSLRTSADYRNESLAVESNSD